jgi:ABC-type branched-subunit amino acid transport system substrate-binding protein
MNAPPSRLGTERSDESAVQIGALVPLARPGWVEAGRHLLAGLELGAGVVNDAGGIGGRPPELVVRDTAADPHRATAAVDELARLGVAALAGEYHRVVARAAAARADALGLLGAGHSRIAVATEPSVYWASGTRILRDRLSPRGGTVIELDVRAHSAHESRRPSLSG